MIDRGGAAISSPSPPQAAPSCVVCPVLYLHAPILLQWRAECLLRHSYWLFRDRLMPIDRKQQVGSFSGPFQCSVTSLPPQGQ
jgi:hypothetical protein